MPITHSHFRSQALAITSALICFLVSFNAFAQALPQPTITGFTNRSYIQSVLGMLMGATSNSSGALSYSSSAPAVAAINAGTGELTINGLGTTTITLNQAASSSYAALSPAKTATVTVTPAIPQAERDVLMSFYMYNGSPFWTHSSGWGGDPNSNPCTWYGVTCTASGDHVVSLDLSSNNLTGVMPNLTGLATAPNVAIRLQGNHFTGAIPALPSSISQFSANNNQLAGTIPDLSGFASLTTFNVSFNQLSGAVPALPPSILVFSANDNHYLTGTLPALPAVLLPTGPKLALLNVCNNKLWSGDPAQDLVWTNNSATVPWLSCQLRDTPTVVIGGKTLFALDDTGQAKTATSPSGGTFTFSSSATSIITVNATTGAITPVAYGSATITVAQAGYQNYGAASATQLVKVQITCRQGSTNDPSNLSRCILPVGALSKEAGTPVTSFNASIAPEAFANPANGNQTIVETDYVGPGPFPVRIDRVFNSSLREWRSTYERQIVPVSSASPSPVNVIRPDGKTFTFALTQQADGTWKWTSDADVNLTLATATGGGWALVDTFAGITEQYGANGLLTALLNSAKALTNPSPAPLTQTVEWLGDVQTVTDPFNRKLDITYVRDPVGRRVIASVATRSPALTIANYAYDFSNPFVALKTATFADSTTRQYTYAATNAANTSCPSAMQGTVKDENGATYFTYCIDGTNRVIENHLGDGQGKVTLTYNTSNNSATVTDPNAPTVAARNRSVGFIRVLGVNRDAYTVQPNGAGTGSVSSSKLFDAAGNATSATDSRGVVTTYGYTSNLVTSQNEASNYPALTRTTTTTLDSVTLKPTKIVEPTRTSEFTYDALGKLTARTVKMTGDPVGKTWSYSYDAATGQIASATDPRGNTTTYSYDSGTGLLSSITNAKQHVSTFAYDANGRLLSITGPDGLATTLTYDARGRVLSKTVGSETTAVTRDAVGQVTRLTRPDGSFFALTYDNAHRLTAIADAAGNSIVYTLDALGNRIAEQRKDPAGAVAYSHTRTFTSLGLVAQEIAPPTVTGDPNRITAFAYDNLGNVLTGTDPLGRVLTNTYDALSRLATTKDAANGVTSQAYDAGDNVTSVTDPKGQQTTYTVNGLDQTTATTSPNTGTATFTYDAIGNVLTKTDARGVTASYTYDELNRIAAIAYSKNSVSHVDQAVTFSYDSCFVRKLCSVTDASGTTTYAYSTTTGKLLSKTNAIAGGPTLLIDYAWDSAGRLAGIATPGDNIISYSYTNGLPTGVAVTFAGTSTSVPILGGVQYAPFGPIKGWTWGNSGVTQRSYDQDYRVTAIQGPVTKNISWDAASRITAINDTTGNQSFGYDLLDRITSASIPAGAYSWTYDAAGNRVTQGASGAATTYTYAPGKQQLNATSGVQSASYGYDEIGSLNNVGPGNAALFTYDDAGRMASATVGGVLYYYKVNALGQRVLKTGGGTTTAFAYDEAGHLLGEYDATGTPIQETVWFAGTPVATLRSGNAMYYVHTDQLGTPRMITRPLDNAMMWRWDSDPFGVTQPNENPAGAGAFRYNLRLPGQYADAETGLYYNGFRDYNPATGRYVESDPIGLGGGINNYAYVGGNPLTGSDPFGLIDVGQFPKEYVPGPFHESPFANHATLVTAGAFIGGMTGAVAAAACTAGSVGICGLGAPILVAGGVALGAASGNAIANAWEQLEKLIDKATDAGPQAVQYALVAERPGLYPTVGGDLVQLDAGDVWKYGMTIDPSNRYPLAAMQTLGLQMEIQATGTRSRVYVAEKLQLIQYYISHGSLPPGNRIFK